MRLRLPRFRRPKPVSNWFRSAARGRGDRAARDEAGDLALRRWAAGATDRLNSGHWARATGATINSDLAGRLETLRARADFEIGQNATLEGVIQTHVMDIVGPTGPMLQVRSENSERTRQLERAWSQWWAMPDLNGQLSGVEMLALAVRYMWSAGEFLAQIVTEAAQGRQATRLRVIDPRRLATPMTATGNANIILGVERSKTGRPLKYWISDELDLVIGTTRFASTPVPAEDMIHAFRCIEADQARGVPWVASALQAIANMRDYDEQVLDAARAAAYYAIMLEATGPDVPFVPVQETVELEPRVIHTAPPGYTASQMQPHQPSTNYIDYHDELVAQLGRPVCMPLMLIKLDARKHTYSSARFDAQVYYRTCRGFRSWLERVMLDRLARIVLREAALADGQALPEDMTLRWNWPAYPTVDPVKDVKASSERLANGTGTLLAECAADGNDWEEVAEQRAKEQDRLLSLGLRATGLGAPQAPDADEPEDEDEEDTDEADAKDDNG